MLDFADKYGPLAINGVTVIPDNHFQICGQIERLKAATHVWEQVQRSDEIGLRGCVVRRDGKFVFRCGFIDGQMITESSGRRLEDRIKSANDRGRRSNLSLQARKFARPCPRIPSQSRESANRSLYPPDDRGRSRHHSVSRGCQTHSLARGSLVPAQPLDAKCTNFPAVRNMRPNDGRHGVSRDQAHACFLQSEGPQSTQE